MRFALRRPALDRAGARTMAVIAADPATGTRGDAAQAIAGALLAGFDKHYALFRECARAAQRHFEAGHFLAIGHVARDRIDFYDRRVAETAERLAREFAADGIEGAGAEALWAQVKRHYVGMLAEHRQPECAETFFNSVSCKLLQRDYFHNRVMFVRPGVATEYLDADLPAYRSYYPRERGLRTAVIDLILDFRLERRFADFRGDLANVLAAFRRRLPRPFVLDANFQIQVLSSLFFRNQSAYIVGRRRQRRARLRRSPCRSGTCRGRRAVRRRAARRPGRARAPVLGQPRLLPGRHGGARRRRSSSCARSCPTRRPPSSTRSSACRSTARRCSSATSCSTCATRPTASSTRRASAGMVMAVFTLPSYPYVFKLIKDRIAASKDTDRARVTLKYALVKHHDRAGRMTDILEYSDVTLPIARFAPGLVDELVALAPSQVEVEGDWVVIRHLYIERRLTPLNLVLDERRRRDARARDRRVRQRRSASSPAVNIFAGDLLFKNFGLTRYGRVVFYDYDEIEYMTDCAFRDDPATAARPRRDVRRGVVPRRAARRLPRGVRDLPAHRPAQPRSVPAPSRGPAGRTLVAAHAGRDPRRRAPPRCCRTRSACASRRRRGPRPARTAPAAAPR